MSRNFATNKLRSKSAVAVALVLVLTMTLTGVALPAANAHTPAWNIPTIAYLSVSPNPIGVGQTASVCFWLDKVPPTAISNTMGDLYQFTVIVTKPNGANETLGPFTSSSEGGASTSYVPDTVGNYTFVMKYPGQTLEGKNAPPPGEGAQMNVAYIGDYMEPSTSNTVRLVVQQEPIQPYPASPLPTTYWQYPVYGTNREWSGISGDWLGFGTQDFSTSGGYNATSNFNPYTTAPNTAHIMWTTPYEIGGQVGGDFQGTGNYVYYNNFLPVTYQPIIMDGVIYTNWQDATSGITGFKAIDLYTGKTLWSDDTTRSYQNDTVEALRCGQTLYFDREEQFGMVPYLWTQTSTAYGVMEGFPNIDALKYSMYDANTGEKILDIVNAVPFNTWTGTRQGPSFLMQDANGDLIGYYLNCTYAVPDNPMTPVLSATLGMWNSTLCIESYKASLTNPDMVARFWSPPQGASIPFSLGIQWSHPIDPSMEFYQLASSGVLICSSDPAKYSQGYPPGVVDVGYSAETGQLLWSANRTAETREFLFSGCTGDGIYTSFTRATDTWTAYSVTTGKTVWTSPPLVGNAWSSYGGESEIAYGNMYAWDYGGYVYCLNDSTGKLLWSWNTGSAGLDTPFGVWPFSGPTVTIADGKIYLPAGKIMTAPLYKGAQMYCLNATTGKQIWSILSYNCFTPPAIAGGYITVCDAYDNQIYSYGIGPSKVTASAQAFGSSIVISGSVTDISAGSQQNEVAANYPNGLPCVSDASMTQFMEAVYMQQPMPSNITGVPVTIMVTDSNHNTRTIGTTSTDAQGFYSLTWTPDIPGNFTVTAVFAGTQSYYGSSANAAFYASPATTTTPTVTSVTGTAMQNTLEYGIVAIAIIILVIGATILIAVTRKRP
jgi:outer membrane protein assembly factor BamB